MDMGAALVKNFRGHCWRYAGRGQSLWHGRKTWGAVSSGSRHVDTPPVQVPIDDGAIGNMFLVPSGYSGAGNFTCRPRDRADVVRQLSNLEIVLRALPHHPPRVRLTFSSHVFVPPSRTLQPHVQFLH